MTETTITLAKVGDALSELRMCGITRFTLCGKKYEMSSRHQKPGSITIDLENGGALEDLRMEPGSECGIASAPEWVDPGDDVIIGLEKTRDRTTFTMTKDDPHNRIQLQGVEINVGGEDIVTPIRGVVQVLLPLGMHTVTVTPPEGWEFVKLVPLSGWGDVPRGNDIKAGWGVRVVLSSTATPICSEGERRGPETCWNETTIHEEECKEGAWWGTGEECPERWIQASVFVQDENGAPLGGAHIDAPNARPPFTGDTTKIVSWNTDWAESKFQIPGATECPITVSKEGYRTKTQIAYGTRTAAENTDFVMEKIPEVPECVTGDVKPGYACIDGYWEPAGDDPLPDEGHTIEFQELITGITPPRVPLLVAGFESLPLMPGWIVRDADGNIVNEGMRLPTLKDIIGW